jgi:hypothetical protein
MGKLIEISLIIWLIIVIPPMIIIVIKWVIEFYKDLFK